MVLDLVGVGVKTSDPDREDTGADSHRNDVRGSRQQVDRRPAGSRGGILVGREIVAVGGCGKQGDGVERARNRLLRGSQRRFGIQGGRRREECLHQATFVHAGTRCEGEGGRVANGGGRRLCADECRTSATERDGSQRIVDTVAFGVEAEIKPTPEPTGL